MPEKKVEPGVVTREGQELYYLAPDGKTKVPVTVPEGFHLVDASNAAGWSLEPKPRAFSAEEKEGVVGVPSPLPEAFREAAEAGAKERGK